MRAELDIVRRIAAEITRPASASVDRDARFPHETFAALKDEGLLSAAVPNELGGLGCSLGELAAMCTVLGEACASTAMIFAMHQIQVFCLVRHGLELPFFRAYLAGLVRQQWLVASGTSEVGVGGDLRSSIAAVETDGHRFHLHKRCSVVSYGEHADALLLTARRTPDAAAGDQVLVLLTKDDCQFEKVGDWNTLGMRGTCSPAIELVANAAVQQIMPGPFRTIASRSMVPCSHVLWGAVWQGLANDAVATARTQVIKESKRLQGATPQGAPHLAEANQHLQNLRACVQQATHELEDLTDRIGGADVLSSPAFAIRSNNVKLTTTELVSDICRHCLLACGIQAYSNDSACTLARHLRDALGAALMISNDRIAASNAALMLLTGSSDACSPPLST